MEFEAIQFQQVVNVGGKLLGASGMLVGGPALCGPCSGRLPAYAALEFPVDDIVGSQTGYQDAGDHWIGAVFNRLRCSVYPVLEICIDAYHVSSSGTFHGASELQHHVEAAQHFLSGGADAEVIDSASGGSCLHLAAGSGSEDLCDLLLDAHASVEAQDRRGSTPLWWALSHERVSVTQLLLARRGRLATLPNRERMTPLHEAAATGNRALLQLLLPHYRNLDVRGHAMRTPLHVAAAEGQLDACALLVRATANPEVTCSRGCNALHYAAALGFEGTELCQLLVQRCPGARRHRNSAGFTPAELAARRATLTPELRVVLLGKITASQGGKANAPDHGVPKTPPPRRRRSNW